MDKLKSYSKVLFAIIGDKDNGKKILEALTDVGGKHNYNSIKWEGTSKDTLYFINENGYLDIHNTVFDGEFKHKCPKLTYEQFKSFFPFNVGEKIKIRQDTYTILRMTTNAKFEIVYECNCDNVMTCLMSTDILEKGEKIEMNKKTSTIEVSLKDAKQWYQMGGEFKNIALKAFSEKELTTPDLPQSWEEFCKNYPVTEKEYALDVSDTLFQCPPHKRQNLSMTFPSKEAALQHIAYIKLHYLRDCYRGNWKPDWSFSNIKKKEIWIIQKSDNKLYVDSTVCKQTFLSFPTEEIAKQFLTNFYQLITEAGDLI